MSISPDGQIGFGTGQGGDDVNRMHDYDDRDLSPLSHHHTLGIGSAQASPGDHIHDGKTSKSISSGGAGVPATTIVTETAFGQASAVGVGTKYARDDHTHGSPAAPTIPAASGSVVSETAFGQAAVVGVAATYSKGDHSHGTPTLTPANAVVSETAFGQAAAIGVITTEFAREDHTHGTPAAPTIPAASGTVVTETAAGQASAVGVATTYSRGDHTHGTPAAGGGPTHTFFEAASTADLTLTAANVDIPGVTVTVNPASASSRVLINVTLWCRVGTGLALLDIIGELFINGVAQAGLVMGDGATINKQNCSQTWAKTIGAGSKIIKMQGRKSAAGGAAVWGTPHSRITVHLIDG